MVVGVERVMLHEPAAELLQTVRGAIMTILLTLFILACCAAGVLAVLTVAQALPDREIGPPETPSETWERLRKITRGEQ